MRPEPLHMRFAFPPQAYQCVPGGGLSLADCEAVCTPQLYKCTNNTCVMADTGLPKAICEANCGPSLRGVVAML